MYRETKWAQELIAAQDANGPWGNFHSLAQPIKGTHTTEQALRRLWTLGFTVEDRPIQKTLAYLTDCLAGKKEMPDHREKGHDWDLFTDLMLATWIRVFTKENPLANRIAAKWAAVLTEAFRSGRYDDGAYRAAWEGVFGQKLRGTRFLDFVSFYQVSLVADQLEEAVEDALMDYLLAREDGIYYIYDGPIRRLPDDFASRQASRYLGALELLSGYRRSLPKLRFAADWLLENRKDNGRWDMGPGVNDKIYFPLSDSWRTPGAREKDCTYRIQKLLNALNPESLSD